MISNCKWTFKECFESPWIEIVWWEGMMSKFTILNAFHAMVSHTTLYQALFVWNKCQLIERSMGKWWRICSITKAFVRGENKWLGHSDRSLWLWSFGFGAKGFSNFDVFQGWILRFFKDCASHVVVKFQKISQNFWQNIAMIIMRGKNLAKRWSLGWNNHTTHFPLGLVRLLIPLLSRRVDKPCFKTKLQIL